MTTAFLLDTCVISESSKPRPRESVLRFFETADNYYLPVAALMEIIMGITMVCAENPLKAVELSKWYHQLVRSGIPIIDTDREVCETWGILACDPRLQSQPDIRSKRSRGSQDLHIAATALVHRLPIATMNVADFMRINTCFPLPGVYDPAEDVWHTRMEPLSDLYPMPKSETLEAERNPARRREWLYERLE
jgi:predicted nucleic acid-binding protein